MEIWETFSKRKKRLERAGQQDIYQYDELPRPFRVQVVHIWTGAIGRYFVASEFGDEGNSPANKFWEFIHNTLCREHGVFTLGDSGHNTCVQCIQYLMKTDDAGALDTIELSFCVIDRMVRKLNPHAMEHAHIKQGADSAIAELNHRFREHGIGYQYESGILVRLDSQFIHAEAVKPALSLLHEAGFDGPADEFIRAFDHYRHGRDKDAVAEALKAFESTMKAICKVRGWPYPPNATAQPLIGILFDKGLVPSDLQSHFAGLRSAMESGLPTVSNRTSRHGQGLEPVAIPPHFAAYALHLAAANIVFLVQAHESLK